MIRIFIGYDPDFEVALQVLSASLIRHASGPLQITPVALGHLRGVFDRPRDPKQSTDFSFSRFLTPYLAGFEGWAIFMDSDMLAVDDIARLWAMRDERYAVMCVKHDHVPKESEKFLRNPQTPYARKNWSSLMLMNCARCTRLTPGYVSTASGLALHRFEWLDDGEIGALPPRWNYLVDYDPPQPVEDLSLLHYTLGGPFFTEFRQCGYADLWRAELARALAPLGSADLHLIEMELEKKRER